MSTQRVTIKTSFFEDREEFDALPNLSILLTHSGNFCFSHEMAYIGKDFYVNAYQLKYDAFCHLHYELYKRGLHECSCIHEFVK